MGRSACCSKDADIKRGAWTAQEDFILKEYIAKHGDVGWRSLPQKAGLKRCGKSCRLRWLNYLRGDINHGKFSPEEEELIVRLHRLLGNRWSLIAGRLAGRTDNQIKNHWNTHLSKKQASEKMTLPCPPARSKPAPTVFHHELKSNPVKAKSVRIAKCPNNSENNGNSNHEDLGWSEGRSSGSQFTAIKSNAHSSTSSSPVHLKKMSSPESGKDIVDTSMQQCKKLTAVNEDEWVKTYNESRVVDWLDELQDLQKSSIQWLSVLMLESEDDLQFL